MSWLAISPIQCVTIHTSALIMRTLSLWSRQVIPPIKSSILQYQLDYLSPWTSYELVISLQGTHNLDLLYNS